MSRIDQTSQLGKQASRQAGSKRTYSNRLLLIVYIIRRKQCNSALYRVDWSIMKNYPLIVVVVVVVVVVIVDDGSLPCTPYTTNFSISMSPIVVCLLARFTAAQHNYQISEQTMEANEFCG
ncbi:hypothetical protein GQX74_012994 [Glossina fuscipes]|nr:hypothetical protein GQX74_012994 [Glossina fuscipes]